jgi:putative 2-oxoglutarate-Fe(II)-dependent oxygenase superfamily protein
MTDAKNSSSMSPGAATAQIDLLSHAIEGRPDAAALFHKLAEAHWRARDYPGYATYFRRGYMLKPVGTIPAEFEPSVDRKNLTAELRDRANRLIEQGVIYASVIADLALAEAQSGNSAAVEYLVDYDRFLRRGIIDPPDGSSLEAFNRALADEIKSNLKFHDTSERAIRHGWRFDGLRRAETPALRTLMHLLRRHVSAYMDGLPDDPTHPFVASRPANYNIDGWAVVSDGTSYHRPHMHPYAWATGVYYVVQPEVSRTPGSDRGWLRIVGPPADADGVAHNNWECRRLIEPAAGSFVLMPAYFWHETKPMDIDQERICVAFEIQPSELHGVDRQQDD